MSRRYTLTVTFKVTDGPKWASHYEITRDNDAIKIYVVKRSGLTDLEAEIPAEEFFRAVAKLKEY